MAVPQARLSPEGPTGVLTGQPGSARPLSSFRLGCNALGDPTALGLAQGLPPHLRVLQ